VFPPRHGFGGLVLLGRFQLLLSLHPDMGDLPKSNAPWALSAGQRVGKRLEVARMAARLHVMAGNEEHSERSCCADRGGTGLSGEARGTLRTPRDQDRP
jgi:hypothetical protein